MKPDEINIAIAEACGWKVKFVADRGGSDGECTHLIDPNGDITISHWGEWGIEGFTNNIPNYYGDLNACHEMEKHAPIAAYCDALYEVLATAHKIKASAVPPSFAIRAESPHRCEAFLRTIGKWREEK